jgi:hypothetical protein
MNNQKYVDEHEAARILGMKVTTLRNWRVQSAGRGPSFSRMGRCVRYNVDNLISYARSCEVYQAKDSVTA